MTIGIAFIAIAALCICQYVRRAAALQQLELTDRCQQKGTRFVNEIRESDKATGIPLENREFTARTHYNTAERKCFVTTEGGMSLPIVGGLIFLTQVWDVNAGVGAVAFAEKALPAKDGTKFYRGQEELSDSPETRKWFDNLMTQ